MPDDESPLPTPPEPERPAEPGTAQAAVVEEAPPVVPPMKKAPARKAPARKAPAKKAPAKKAPAKKAPAKKAPAKRAPAKRAPALPLPVAPPPVDVVPGLREVPARPAPARRSPAWVRVLAALTVLLLAAAAGLGTAALVLHARQTWTAQVPVRLQAPTAPTTDPAQALRSALDRFQGAVATTTSTAETVAGVGRSDVRADLEGVRRGDVIVVRARTAYRKQAPELARAGADALVAAVAADQQPLSEGNRVTAAVDGAVSASRRTAPSTAKAATAGGIAAGSVLVLGLLLVVSRRRHNDD